MMQTKRKASPLNMTLIALALAFISSANCCNVTQCEHETIGIRVVLNCSSRGFRCIPPNIPNADIVDLSDNQITELNFDESYNKVRELYLNNNNVQRYNYRVKTYRLPRYLEVLSMNNNLLFNSRRLNLYSLRELYLNHINLLGLPELRNNPMIEVVSANYNSLSGEFVLLGDIRGSRFRLSCEYNRISKVVLQLNPSMQQMNVSIKLGYNRITEFVLEKLGSNYTTMQNEIYFDLALQHNPLSSITLVGWTPSVLNIDHTGVCDLKRQINISHSELSVNRLYTRNNSMTTLIQPDWAWNLHYINADLNEIQYLAVETLQGFGELRELHMIGNRIAFISKTALEHLKKLELLYLDNNEITSLHGGIFLNQTNLITLSVTNNRISSLHPDDFIGLDSLVSLYLSSNRLLNVNPVVFRSIPTLNILDMSNNSLLSFDPGACNDFPVLQDLTLSWNHIDDISNVLQHCESMETLNAEWNDIKTVSGPMIGPTVSSLELVGNPLHCDCRVASLRAWLLNHEPRQFPSCKDQQTSRVLNETDSRSLGCRAPKAESGTPSVVVNAGDNALLTCQVSGSPAPTLSWLSPSGTTLTNGFLNKFYIVRSTDLMIYSVGLDDAGNFTCSAANDIGEQDSVLVNLKIIEESVSSGISKLALTVFSQTILACVITAVVVIFVAVALYFCLIKKRHRKSEPSVNLTANPEEVSSAQIEIGESGVSTLKDHANSVDKSVYQELLIGESGVSTLKDHANSVDKSVYQELLKDQVGSEPRSQQPLPNENATSLGVGKTLPESDNNDYETPNEYSSLKSPSKIPVKGIYTNDCVARPRTGRHAKKYHEESLVSIPGRPPTASKREVRRESCENKYEEI